MKRLPHRCCYALILAILPCLGIAQPKPVAIDAGHSMAHSGAVSAYGKPEFAYNAALAATISDLLVAQGVPVIKIGHDGKMDDLKKRPQLANAAGAAFFLSIHHDSAQPHYFKPWQWQGKNLQHTEHGSGFSLFVSRKNPYLTNSLACASALGKALKQAGFYPSQHHAEKIVGENKEWADQENGVFYYDNLVVLKSTAMPAVLLEAAVIANRQDEEKLQTPQMHPSIAAEVAKGLSACNAIPTLH